MSISFRMSNQILYAQLKISIWRLYITALASHHHRRAFACIFAESYEPWTWLWVLTCTVVEVQEHLLKNGHHRTSLNIFCLQLSCIQFQIDGVSYSKKCHTFKSCQSIKFLVHIIVEKSEKFSVDNAVVSAVWPTLQTILSLELIRDMVSQSVRSWWSEKHKALMLRWDCCYSAAKEFDEIVSSASPKALIIVDFYKTACGSCRYIQPGFVKLCRSSQEEHAPVVFLKHNVIDE